MSDVSPIPEEYTRVSPYLCVDGAADAIEFYKEVFGAEERMRIAAPDGKIGHAEITIGDCIIMVADEYEESQVLGPKKIGGTPVTISVYVEDVDATYAKAIEKGAKSLREVKNQFYGDRAAKFEDPFGHAWSVASRFEIVSKEEILARAEKLFGGG